MSARAALPALALAPACALEGFEPSLIDDTRVVAVVADPPDAAPGAAVEVEVVVADPRRRGAEVLAWLCTPGGGEGCAEADGLLQPVEERLAVAPVGEEGSAHLQLVAPAGAAAAAGLELRLWALACAPGQCPVIGRARRVLAGGEDAGIDEALGDPASWFSDLPLEGTSLAHHAFRVGDRPAAERNHPPTVEPRFDDADLEVVPVEAGGEQAFAFAAGDPDGDEVSVWGWTTLGRFADRDTTVSEGSARLVLSAPDEPGEGEVFVVFDDGRGGTACYRTAIAVR